MSIKQPEMDLQKFFDKLVNKKLPFFSTVNTIPFWISLENRYKESLGLKENSTEAVRTYHNLDHIRNGLATIINISKEYSSEVIEDVAMAWFYHDCVYNVVKSVDKDPAVNEVCSGLVALKDLIEMGWTAEQAGLMYDLVMWTKHNKVPAIDDDRANLIVDVDLMGMASDREVFAATSHNVRLEFFQATDEQWIDGRKAFWKNFLSTKGSKIFQTKPFQNLNEKAKGNILYELECLEKGIIL